jgi:hypothetical protein
MSKQPEALRLAGVLLDAATELLPIRSRKR